MARQARLVLPGLAHLVSLQALKGVDPFPTEADRDRFLALMREAAVTASLQVHAHALLPDQVRVLATPNEAAAISSWVQAVGRRYVSAYNRSYSRSGTLWAGRFRCAPVEPGAWCLRALRFVDGASADRALTSAGQRCGGPRAWPWVDPPEYWALGNTPFERESAYERLLAEPLSETELDKMCRCLTGGWVCSSGPFASGLHFAATRRASPRPRGRPLGSTT